MKWLCVNAAALLMLWAMGAMAADSNGFYMAQVPVTSQSPDERAKAAAVGLREVLWRVTGVKITEQTPGMGAIFSRAETYMDSFQYGALANNSEGFRQQVGLQFSAQALSQLVQDHRLPFWPTNRPKILVWLVRDDSQAPRFINAASDPAIMALTEAARVRGISLVFPNLDSDDLSAVSPRQLLQNDFEALLNASFRYNLDTLLIGKIGASQTEWQLDHRGDKQTLANADVAAGVHFMADYLAKRYAVVANASAAGSGVAFISVEVADFAGYRAVTTYLKKQSQLANFKLLEAQPTRLLLELSLRGSLSQFDNGLSLDHQLEPLTPNTGELGSLEKPVAYRWIAK